MSLTSFKPKRFEKIVGVVKQHHCILYKTHKEGTDVPLILRVLIIYISGGTYSLKSTPNDRFVETLFLALLFYSPSKLIGHYNPSVRITT